MNADAISQKILDDARAAAAHTLADAHERAQDMRKKTEAALAQKRAASERKIAEDCDLQRSRMLRMAELDQKKALLGAKREVIEQVFDTALAGMRNMPLEQRRAYNKKLLLSVAQGGEAVAFEAGDEALFDAAFFSDVNAELLKKGRVPVRLWPERHATGGGFALISAGAVTNCSYEAVLGQSKPGLEAEVAKLLFGEA